MKFSLSLLRTLIISGLLIVLGGVVEYRYGLVEKLPLKMIAAQPSSKDVDPRTLSNLLNPEPPSGSNQENVDFSIFWQAWKLLEDNYVDPDKLQTGKMIDGAVSGMTASLGDPYTAYLPKEDNARVTQDLAGTFYGVGIELGYVEGVLAVVSPLSGTPAEKAGIQPGDLILNIKDDQKKINQTTTNLPLTQAVDIIRGPKNSPVTLTIYRKSKGGDPFEVTLQRDEIIVKSVELSFIEQNGKRVAHIKLSRFGERTMDEWNDAVSQILQQKGSIDGIVLDMRNNPGGYFDDAIGIASDFIKNGVIVSQKSRTDKQDFNSTGKYRLQGIPLVVLVNGGSASASEIVTGALKDQLNVKLVGKKTFGKGTVQDVRNLPNGASMHITIAKWLMPKGEWIHEAGIPVDVEVEDNPNTPEDEMLQKAIETLQ